MHVLFYILAAVTVAAALGVILQRTPVYSALSLIVVLASLALIYLTLNAPFIAVIQVIVYAGAIMVLFVLVIMLLNARREEQSNRSRLARFLGLPLLVVFMAEILVFAWRSFAAEAGAPPPMDAGPRAIGALLFHNYVLPFEVTSLLILVAILGAVVLAKKKL